MYAGSIPTPASNFLPVPRAGHDVARWAFARSTLGHIAKAAVAMRHRCVISFSNAVPFLHLLETGTTLRNLFALNLSSV